MSFVKRCSDCQASQDKALFSTEHFKVILTRDSPWGKCLIISKEHLLEESEAIDKELKDLVTKMDETYRKLFQTTGFETKPNLKHRGYVFIPQYLKPMERFIGKESLSHRECAQLQLEIQQSLVPKKEKPNKNICCDGYTSVLVFIIALMALQVIFYRSTTLQAGHRDFWGKNY